MGDGRQGEIKNPSHHRHRLSKRDPQARNSSQIPARTSLSCTPSSSPSPRTRSRLITTTSARATVAGLSRKAGVESPELRAESTILRGPPYPQIQRRWTHPLVLLSALSSALSSALNSQLSTLNSQLSAQLSALNSQLSTLNSQLSALSSQLSAPDSQLSTAFPRLRCSHPRPQGHQTPSRQTRSRRLREVKKRRV